MRDVSVRFVICVRGSGGHKQIKKYTKRKEEKGGEREGVNEQREECSKEAT